MLEILLKKIFLIIKWHLEQNKKKEPYEKNESETF